MTNDDIVKKIQAAMKAKDVTVGVQPALTTSSYYLTFDGGLLGKARVGDHTGKGYAYTYEIGAHYREAREVTHLWLGKEVTRYLYPPEGVDDLITQVLVRRSNMKAKYGKDWYEKQRKR